MKKMIMIGAILVAAPAHAQSRSAAGSGTAATTADASETICRTIRDTGSRLNRTRVCMTRAEWAEHRRETRQNVEQDQTRRVERQFGG